LAPKDKYAYTGGAVAVKEEAEKEEEAALGAGIRVGKSDGGDGGGPIGLLRRETVHRRVARVWCATDGDQTIDCQWRVVPENAGANGASGRIVRAAVNSSAHSLVGQCRL
jgi:hypothetical protein